MATFTHFSGMFSLLTASAFDLSQSLLSCQMVLVGRSAIYWAHYGMEWAFFLLYDLPSCVCVCWGGVGERGGANLQPSFPFSFPPAAGDKMIMVIKSLKLW